jgi:heme a synthase
LVLSTQSLAHQQYNRTLHRLAVLTAIATFPLIFMGGLVTSHGAGMSVPDWPNTYGYNMFLFPPRLWIGGIFYEHTHRLMGTVVGLCSIVLALAAWKYESRRWARRLCYGVLAAVIFQGVLGGLRVVLVKLDLAIVHACVAQAFFCLATLSAIVTSRWWIDAPDLSGTEDRAAGAALIAMATTCVLVVYLQLIVGATMRHYHAGLAIPDLPLAYGHIIPPTTATELARVNAHRAFDLDLKPVSLWQIWLHFGHRIGAVLVTAMIAIVATLVFRNHRRRRELLFPAIILLALLAGQITLGVLTVLLRKPADIASAHVAVGALVLMTSFLLAVRAMRLYATVWRHDTMAQQASPAVRHAADNLREEILPVYR